MLYIFRDSTSEATHKGSNKPSNRSPPQPKPKTRERRLATEPQRKHLQRFRRQTVGWIFQHRPRAGEETPEPERPEGEDRPSERGASVLEPCQDPGRRAWSPEKVQRQWLGRDILQSQDEAQHRPAVAGRYLQPPAAAASPTSTASTSPSSATSSSPPSEESSRGYI